MLAAIMQADHQRYNKKARYCCDLIKYFVKTFFIKNIDLIPMNRSKRNA
jgi:hypothetical protein